MHPSIVIILIAVIVAAIFFFRQRYECVLDCDLPPHENFGDSGLPPSVRYSTESGPEYEDDYCPSCS